MPRRTKRRTKARRSTTATRKKLKRASTRKTSTKQTPTSYATSRPTEYTPDSIAERTWRVFGEAMKGFEYKLQRLSGVSQKTWRGWATRFAPQELVSMAQSHRATWEKDIAGLANNVATVIKQSSDWLPDSEEIVRDAKRNIGSAYNKVKHSSWMRTACDVARAGKNDILSVLNIPSQHEVEDLQRKLATLEHRLTTVMLRGAKNR